MAESADAWDLKSQDSDIVRVQVSLSALGWRWYGAFIVVILHARVYYNACCCQLLSRCGGIGRHARFRFWFFGVKVRVFSSALTYLGKVVRTHTVFVAFRNGTPINLAVYR